MQVSPAQGVGPIVGSHTYVASLRLAPTYSTLDAGLDRSERKVQAVERLRSAESAVRATLEPQLDALRGAGLLAGYEFLPLAGAVLLHVDAAQALDSRDAFESIAELGQVVDNRMVQFVPTPGAAPADTPPPPPPIAAELRDGMAWQVPAVGADAAWKQGITGQGVVIGMVDSGADPSHPAIGPHYRGTGADGAQSHDHNFYDAMDPTRSDLHDAWGHGTNTTSLAVGGSTEARTGIAPGAKFIAARVFGGGSTDLATMLRGASWMLAPTDSAGANADAAKAPDVVNMSFGARGAEGMLYENVLRAYEAAGIVAVAAAGNGGRRGPGTVLAPAMFPTVLAAGFTDRTGALDPRTAQGPGSILRPDGTPVDKPDVVAPGSGVDTALIGGGYGELAGSSLSSAVVSGVAALLLGRHPRLTPAQVREAITSSARDVDTPGFDSRSGHGAVDVMAALRRADELVAAGTSRAPRVANEV